MIIGNKYGRLTVLAKSHQNYENRWFYTCMCECGKIVTAPKNGLKYGYNKSCGCLNRDSHKTHGMKYTKEYRTWSGMKGRCLCPTSKDNKNYGGRGISVCRSWTESFVNFFNDMGYAPTEKHQIERVNNNLDYSKSNCKWATAKENSLNKRNSRFWFIRGSFFESAIDASSFWEVSESTIRRWCNGGDRTKPKKDCHTARRYANVS